MYNIKLFCIPYSGGNAGVYYKWKNSLLPGINLCPIEVAGHGRRIKEGFYDDVEAAADDLSEEILRELKEDEPYAIFGHSLGALITFEVYYALKRKGAHEPVHIFFSGRKSPDDIGVPTATYKLPEKEFMEKVSWYGGGTGEIMQNRELLNVFVPILRADFRIGETYEYKPHSEKIKCDITIMNGTEDGSVMTCDLERWKQHAEKKCGFERVKGSHFFIIENIEETVAIINNVLKERLS
nr:thioesterase domain-containing protein [uncultured Lachnoclostridium sp.]